jgi:hypothetical protein
MRRYPVASAGLCRELESNVLLRSEFLRQNTISKTEPATLPADWRAVKQSDRSRQGERGAAT